MPSTRSASRLALALLTTCTLIGSAQAQADRDGSMPTDVLIDFQSYLDSLQASSSTLSREGIEDTWAVADSVETLIIEDGPAFADTAESRTFRSWNFNGDPGYTTFNRVEGFRLGARVGVRYGEHSLDVAGGYGFSNDDWRYRSRLSIGLGRYGRLRAQYADDIVAYGQAPVSGNAIYAFIAGADDQNYLRREGFEVGLERDVGDLTWSVDYQQVDESSVPAATDWNLFQRKRGPRVNPPVTTGQANRILIGITGTWSAARARSAVSRLKYQSQITGYGLGGDLEYDRHYVELKTDFRGPWRDDIRLLLQVGGARNGPPTQGQFFVGGPNMLRAYGVHERAGDRLLAASLDYHFGTDFFAAMGLRWAELQFVPFAEIGAAWFDPNGTGVFSKPASSDWRSDVGLGMKRNIAFGASARADLAYRLDRSRDRFTWRFRFELPLFNQF